MQRRAATVVGIITIAFVVVIGLAQAQPPGCRQSDFGLLCDTYLANITVAPPTPTPPPDLSTLVLQPSDVPSGFQVSRSEEVTNEEAAESYGDPVAALVAFQQQGRQSSWFVGYRGTATLVSDQVIRYLTIEGANAGFDYSVANELQQWPDYGGPLSESYGDRAVLYIREFMQGDIELVKFLFVIRQGSYVALVQITGTSDFMDTDTARAYAFLATARLP